MNKITIAIPIYNVEEYIERCLNSVLAQTYENIEVLAIDDKGGDNSIDVVKRVQSEHHRGGVIKIIDHIHNRGTGAVRNSGIDNATGEYLFYVDSDDEITPDCIEKHYKVSKETNADFTFAERMVVEMDGRQRRGRVVSDSAMLLDGQSEVVKWFYGGIYRCVVTWNRLYRLSFLRDNNVRCVDGHLAEDNLFSFQVVINATRVALIPDVTYLYYMREGSYTNKPKSRGTSERINQSIEIAELKLKYASKHKQTPLYRMMMDDVTRSYIAIKRSQRRIINSGGELPADFDARVKPMYGEIIAHCSFANKLRLYTVENMPYGVHRVTDIILLAFSKQGWVKMREKREKRRR